MPDPSAYGVPLVAVAVWLTLLRGFAVSVAILTFILLAVLYPMIFGLWRSSPGGSSRSFRHGSTSGWT